jgi:hypothetical protein
MVLVKLQARELAHAMLATQEHRYRLGQTVGTTLATMKWVKAPVPELAKLQQLAPALAMKDIEGHGGSKGNQPGMAALGTTLAVMLVGNRLAKKLGKHPELELALVMTATLGLRRGLVAPQRAGTTLALTWNPHAVELVKREDLALAIVTVASLGRQHGTAKPGTTRAPQMNFLDQLRSRAWRTIFQQSVLNLHHAVLETMEILAARSHATIGIATQTPRAEPRAKASGCQQIARIPVLCRCYQQPAPRSQLVRLVR